MIKKCGFFDEIDSELAIGYLENRIDGQVDPDEGRILSYLRAGTQIIAQSGLSFDLLSESHEPISPPHVFTDGEWVWTADIIYYVSKYHMKLPKTLVSKAKALGWICPPVDTSVATQICMLLYDGE